MTIDHAREELARINKTFGHTTDSPIAFIAQSELDALRRENQGLKSMVAKLQFGHLPRQWNRCSDVMPSESDLPIWAWGEDASCHVRLHYHTGQEMTHWMCAKGDVPDRPEEHR